MKRKQKDPVRKNRGRAREKLLPWQRAAGALMVLLLSALWVAAFFPDKRVWGINHWAYFPLWLRTSVIGLGLLALVPRVNQRLQSFLRHTVVSAFRSLMLSRRHLLYLFAVVASLLLFYLFRTRIPLLGDGFQITQSLSTGTLSVNWSQPLAIWIYLTSFDLLRGVFHLDGVGTYALVSYLSGAIFVVFSLRVATFLSKDASTQLFVFLVLILMGSTQLFLGYAEHYPLLFSGILVYLFYALKSLRRETRALVPLMIFILLLPLHLSSLYLLPSALFLLLYSGGKEDLFRFPRGKRMQVMLLFLAVIGAGTALYVWKYSWYVFSYLMPLFHGNYAGPGYTLFSPSHLLDFLNQQLLVSPAGLALLFIFLVFRPELQNREKHSIRFLLIVSVGQLLFNFLVDPGLGAPRDWDLFASVGLGYTLLGLFLFSRVTVRIRTGYLKFGLITVALLFTLPWMTINAHPDMSISRFRHLLDLDPRRSRNGHFILAGYFDSVGRTEEVDRENRMIKEKLPEAEYVNEAFYHMRQGELQSAYAKINQAIRIAPDFGEAYSALGKLHALAGDMTTAESMFRKTLQLQPDCRSAYAGLGDIYAKKGQLDKAKVFYVKALRLGLADPEVFNNLAILYAQIPDLDKAALYYRKAIAIRSDFSEARYGLAFVYYHQGRLDESLQETNLLLKSNPEFHLAYHQLGLIYEALGRKADALEAYQTYLKMQPDDPRSDQIRKKVKALQVP